MKAIISDPVSVPRYGDFADPVGDERLSVVDVRAAALTNLDIAVATGRHYFSGRGEAVVGREAVVTAPSGERLFLNAVAIPSPFGSMAERTLADLDGALRVPDGIADDLAAALGNAGLAGWLPLSWRARMRPGETALVLGATGVTGRIAVAAARLLGAGRVIAAGRNTAMLDRLLASGADAIVRLGAETDLTQAYRAAADGGIDVVLDYLNGPPAEAALGAMATSGRMVQIGSTLAPGITLHAQIARRASLDVLGFAYYHAPVAEQRAAYAALCAAAMDGAVDVALAVLPLERFAEAWHAQRAGAALRYVLRP